jgi:putative membrane protein
MHDLFTDADRERIRVAVANAERATSGEIVPYVVARSGMYEVALWRGGAIGAFVAAVAGLGAGAAYEGWGLNWLYAAEGILALVLLGGLAGSVAALAPPIRRLLAGRRRLDENVTRRATQAFVEEEVFDTRDRTGILLFVSLLEHRLIVLGDAGVNAKVQPGEWSEVVDLVRNGIRRGAPADGLVAAIDKCGEILHRRGVELRDDDSDELRDEVRLRKE